MKGVSSKLNLSNSGSDCSLSESSTPTLSKRGPRPVKSFKEHLGDTLNCAKSALSHVSSHAQLRDQQHLREVAGDALKHSIAEDWLPEYRPTSVVPSGRGANTVLESVTHISSSLILNEVPMHRKTKIACCLGPACWDEETLTKMVMAGMDAAFIYASCLPRFPGYEDYKPILETLKKVSNDCNKHITRLIDMPGPTMYTAMLRGGRDIDLETGEKVNVFACGDNFSDFTGYKVLATGEIRIGLSYPKLCQSVKKDSMILIDDGAIRIRVEEILSETELCGVVVVGHKLGQRKNFNLPGTPLDIPPMAEEEVEGLCKLIVEYDIDMVAVAFVQSPEDMTRIRKALDDVGAYRVQLVAQIENEMAIKNLDAVLAVSDGIAIGRGNLAMEVPPEKLALCQKMIIAKCQLAGKFVITSTQMLESMSYNPLPTRAEMTDAANAVFDGTDCVALVEESAFGAYPVDAVTTLSSILETAELAVDYTHTYDWIQTQINAKQGFISPLEAAFASVSKLLAGFHIDTDGDGVRDASEGSIAVVLTKMGLTAELVSKYRPPCAVLVISPDPTVLRLMGTRFGLFTFLVPEGEDNTEAIITAGIKYAVSQKMAFNKSNVVILTGTRSPWADESPQVTVVSVEDHHVPTHALPLIQTMPADSMGYVSPLAGDAKGTVVTNAQSLFIATERLLAGSTSGTRSAKIIATLGSATESVEAMYQLLKAGVSLVRIDLTMESHDKLQIYLDNWKAMVEATVGSSSNLVKYTPHPGVVVTLNGPGVKTSAMRGGSLTVREGQHVQLLVVSSSLFEGYYDPESLQTKIGILYQGLSTTVGPGDFITMQDGTVKLKVLQVLSDTVSLAEVVSKGSHAITSHALVGFPDKRLRIPLLSEITKRDIAFVAKHGCVDFVTMPFIRSAADVQDVRKALDSAGGYGPHIQVYAQIDSRHGLVNFDEILEVADGIVISRARLGMSLAAEKVALAQKYMIAKANIAGRPIIVAAHLLDSMVDNPIPTRAELTDVANALYDGVDAIMLRYETSCGLYPTKAVLTASAILKEAQVGIDHYAQYNHLRNYTPKPMATLESVSCAAVKAAIDMSAQLICIVTNSLTPVRAVSKYRPPQSIVVATTNPMVAKQCNVHYGAVPFLIPAESQAPVWGVIKIKDMVVEFARANGLAEFVAGDEQSDQLILMSGPHEALFITEAELSQVEFVTVVVGGGEEASDIIAHSSYVGEDTIAYRSTKVGLDLICEPIDSPRKTKLFCTMGPACWSEEGIAKLLEAGMNVARFNFSHGDHASHQEVLDRLRKVAAEKKAHVAVLLDTKGPEVRTAMLRDHQPIELEAGQELTVVAAGEEYTSWEGYKDSDTGETKIGLSYALLCADMKPGMRILIGDGTLILEVMEILSAKELKAKSLNSHKLGERKNCNLPGVKIQLPVLTAKDVQDVEQFACKNRMDFIAASFVQTAEDVRFIRKTLDHAGGKRVQIISKIESAHGLMNYDGILRESDGIMVARGDLAMEIPSEKVALAQKMLITKANIAGKFIVCATQMLESMIENPLPTRAEMTDVANAVFDGTDAVMLSGETANGKFSYEAAATMAAIVANAEVGVNNYQTYDFIRDFSEKPMTTSEAVLGCACMNAIDVGASMILVVTSSGIAARLVAKYRPPVPVLVVTNNVATMRQCLPVFSLHPYFVADLPSSRTDIEFDMMIETAILFAMEKGLCTPGKDVIVVHGCTQADAETIPMVTIKIAPGEYIDPHQLQLSKTKTLSLRTTAISLKDVLDYSVKPRKTKIVCTMGPACWSEEGMTKLLDAGMNVARFNFSHGDHAGHQEVLDRLRKVSQHVGRRIAYLLDTKGPEVRTAMVRDGKEINLEAGQEVTLVAVGEDYTTWEGFKDESTGETKIGISYAKLCQSVQPGYRILISDGTLVIQVLEILSDTELRGKCLNSKKLGPRKNCNLPGVKVDIPVLTSKDVEDLQHFCVKNKMDFVAASFVQTGDDVKFIRKILDDAGGVNVKIISKIENAAGLEHYDAILKESDGIMVARGDLAMEIPSEKVALAQKMLITKANIAGKFVITATQMLESMCNNPLPTRAEMTDVANAVFDGTDAVMLSGETANGKFPDTAVKTMAAITANAENTNSYVATQCFIRDHSKKPFSRGEAFGALATSTMVECDAQLIIVISTDGFAARMASKYRPNVPMIVVTTADHVANQCSASFGAYAIRVPNYPSILECIEVAKAFALSERLWQNSGIGVILHGRNEVSADKVPVMRIVDLSEDWLAQPDAQDVSLVTRMSSICMSAGELLFPPTEPSSIATPPLRRSLTIETSPFLRAQAMSSAGGSMRLV